MANKRKATTLSLSVIANSIGAELKGNSDRLISNVATLEAASEGDITFLANTRYRKFLKSTEASAVIVSPRDSQNCPVDCLIIDDPYLGYARTAALLFPLVAMESGIHPSAVVSPDASIDESAWIGAQCVVEAGVVVGANSIIGSGCILEDEVVIGEDCHLVAHITICYQSSLGNRILIHPGVVIGADGFGIAKEQNHWVKVPQLGAVRIYDDVEIGANTTIDRGALGDTILEEGVKLDNQIQIAHNVCIGAHTAIAACTGVAGSARIGKNCAIGGGVGILGHLEIVDEVQVTAMSLVTKSIKKPGIYSSGTPLDESDSWRKNYLRMKQLDDMARRIAKLEMSLRSQ
ncbi:MAG: UDP-3-O-(3-hydroxymyristoyl)glucosamine N-acyltransferase [Gammaproteobacteria bacterium]|nr:UDP-3-O-(3-hydroxymyristoyl)glucosamine N-acyltransferase [Gammaproteobacteria bacterium]